MTTMVQATYSSAAVCEMVGISYRQLDYWLRQGNIEVDEPTPGSGRQRVWTDADVARLRIVVTARNEALAIMKAFASGELWREAS